MAQGVSLHIGASEFFSAASPPQVDLSFAADAGEMEKIAQGKGFQSELLVGPNVTYGTVKSSITKYERNGSQALQAGDLFLLTFSGHGNQLELEPESGADIVHFKQSWLLRDREVFDAEIEGWLQGFHPRVRIVVVSDSCNSGSIIEGPLVKFAKFLRGLFLRPFLQGAELLRERVLRDDEKERILSGQEARRQQALELLEQEGRRPAPSPASTRPLILLLAACGEDESARATNNGKGLFTSVLVEVWNNGAFPGTYDSFHADIQTKVKGLSNNAQTPTLLRSPSNNPLADERPFTIGPAPAPAVQPSNAGPVVVSGQPLPAGG